jgi:ADP-heptose:LPS heptosyltransferase
MPTERAAYQLFFAGIRNRVGVGHKLYEVITFMKSVVRNNYIPLRHESDYCMDLAGKIGVKAQSIQPEIFVTDEEKKEARDFFTGKGIPSSVKLIFIHTGTLGSAPNWSERKYFELIRSILKNYEAAHVILTAREMSDNLREKINEINSKRIADISKDADNLRDLIKLISRADIMICSSTGPLHIADALNVSCIGLYCSRPMSSAKRWGVVNKRSVNLQITAEYCSGHCSADQNKCAFENGISIDTVLHHVDALLKK